MTKDTTAAEKKHKIWFEFRAKEKTQGGFVLLDSLVKTIEGVSAVAEKRGFDAIVMGIPTDVSDYVPTGKEIQIEKLSDLVEKLTPEQFEMCMIDLRKWAEHGRQAKEMLDNKDEINKNLAKVGVKIKVEENWQHFLDGMTWQDTGEHKINTQYNVQS